MADDSKESLNRELQRLSGAINLIFELREEFAQWLEEAQDDSKQEALENVLGHVEAIESEYKHRLDEVKARLNEI